MSTWTVLLFPTLFSLRALASLSLTSDGCVDPSGFESCYNDISSQAQTCYQQNCEGGGVCSSPDDCANSDPNCVMACTAGAYQGWLNCAMQSCWNKAYTCEFQNLEVTAIRQSSFALNAVTPPYYNNIPSQSEGACSCNLNALYTVIREVSPLDNRCTKTTSGIDQFEACNCCAASQALSALPDLCPSTDPSSIPFYSGLDALQDAPKELESSYCTGAEDPAQLNCPSLGFVSALGQFYDASNLPSPGSEAVSNAEGSLTAPLQATIVWSLAQGMSPATAVAASGSSGGGSGGGSGGSSGGTGSGSGSVSGSGSGTSSGSGSSASGSPSSSSSSSSSKSSASVTSLHFSVWDVAIYLTGVFVLMHRLF